MSKIKHRQARESLNDLVGEWKYDGTLGQYINQQENQEKLLELYKELSLLERKRATTLKTKNVDKYNQLNKEIEIINEQIKELESEK